MSQQGLAYPSPACKYGRFLCSTPPIAGGMLQLFSILRLPVRFPCEIISANAEAKSLHVKAVDGVEATVTNVTDLIDCRFVEFIGTLLDESTLIAESYTKIGDHFDTEAVRKIIEKLIKPEWWDLDSLTS